jgi:hypothetical protein
MKLSTQILPRYVFIAAKGLLTAEPPEKALYSGAPGRPLPH